MQGQSSFRSTTLLKRTNRIKSHHETPGKRRNVTNTSSKSGHTRKLIWCVEYSQAIKPNFTCNYTSERSQASSVHGSLTSSPQQPSSRPLESSCRLQAPSFSILFIRVNNPSGFQSQSSQTSNTHPNSSVILWVEPQKTLLAVQRLYGLERYGLRLQVRGSLLWWSLRSLYHHVNSISLMRRLKPKLPSSELRIQRTILGSFDRWTNSYIC